MKMADVGLHAIYSSVFAFWCFTLGFLLAPTCVVYRMSAEGESATSKPLTATQRATIERNRQKALLLRQAKLTYQPHSKNSGSMYVCNSTPVVDSGGGFFIEEEEEEKEDVESSPPKKNKISERLAPLEDKLLCSECGREFQDSYLFNHFEEPVCDNCRSMDEKYELITRTKCREQFLLKDADLDKREPILKFILRRNPHNKRWGDMKLYLYSQIHARAMQVWGSEAELEEQRDKNDTQKEKSKQKKFDKKIKGFPVCDQAYNVKDKRQEA